MLWAVEAAVEEATRRGLTVERVLNEHPNPNVSKRYLLIAGKRCQAVPAPLLRPHPRYPNAVARQIYLPRTEWPDFLIYVAGPESRGRPVSFYIVPRGMLSKDTALSPVHSWIKEYEDAWHLLTDRPDSQGTVRRFQVLSPKVRIVLEEAKRRGLRVTLKRRPRPWPTFHQNRLWIERRNCRVLTANRLSDSPEDLHYSYVCLRALPKEKSAQFFLYVLAGKGQEPQRVYVVPRNRVVHDTCVSLSNSELAQYADAWDLLTAEAASSFATEMDSTDWIGKRRPKADVAPNEIPWTRDWIGKRRSKADVAPKEMPWSLGEVMSEAARRELTVELVKDCRQGVSLEQKCLLIQGKRCQILQTRILRPSSLNLHWMYVTLNLPKTTWPEYLIYVVRPEREGQPPIFFVVPRNKLSRRTTLSPTSSWLREHENAWDLLRESN